LSEGNVLQFMILITCNLLQQRGNND